MDLMSGTDLMGGGCPKNGTYGAQRLPNLQLPLGIGSVLGLVTIEKSRQRLGGKVTSAKSHSANSGSRHDGPGNTSTVRTRSEYSKVLCRERAGFK